jgi:hypothetical protein
VKRFGKYTQSSSSSNRVEIPPKTRYKQTQNEISHINVNIYDKAATSQQNSD